MKTSLDDIMNAVNLQSDTRLIETCDEFVSFLFDKVELFGWRIDNYNYNPRAHVTGITDDLRSFIYGDRFTVTISKEIEQ